MTNAKILYNLLLKKERNSEVEVYHPTEVKGVMKAIIPVLVLLVTLGMVSAVNSFIVPEVLTIQSNDLEIVDYCVENPTGTPFPGVDISITEWCKDANGIVGCQPADSLFDPELAVAALDVVTGADGCGDVQLTATGASGTFYYTIAGSLGGVQITSETGTALVPEFGVIGSSLALVLAGVLIWRKRK